MHKKVKKVVDLMLTRSIGSNRAGTILKAKRGYAENYLIPNGYGIAVIGNEAIIQEQMKEWETEDEAKRSQADSILEKLKFIKLCIKAESGTGATLFGSISSSTLSKELKQHDISVSKQDIVMNPIKTLGEYKVKIKLYGGASTEIDLSVVPIGSQ